MNDRSNLCSFAESSRGERPNVRPFAWRTFEPNEWLGHLRGERPNVRPFAWLTFESNERSGDSTTKRAERSNNSNVRHSNGQNGRDRSGVRASNLAETCRTNQNALPVHSLNAVNG